MGECTSIRKIIKKKINFLYSPNMVKFKVDNKNFIQSKLNLNEFKFGRRRFEELSASTKKKTIHMLINIQFLYVFLQVLREYSHIIFGSRGERTILILHLGFELQYDCQVKIRSILIQMIIFIEKCFKNSFASIFPIYKNWLGFVKKI